MNQKVAGSTPGQSTCLGCGPGPNVGGCERQLINVIDVMFLLHNDHIDVSLLSLSLLSL